MPRKNNQIVISKETLQTILIALGAFAILILVTLVSFRYAKGQPVSIVLPNGLTYTGPASPTPVAYQPPNSFIPVPTDTQWKEQKGLIFPYSFSYPLTLSLGVFPGDPFDSVTIFWNNTNPQENLLLRVEDLNKNADMKQYVNKPKKEYVNVWWKQYTWKGIESITEFSNSKELKGYRAKFKDTSGKTPYDNIFFEVPNKPNLVIWMSTKLLSPDVFDKIADSVSWGK